MDRLAKGKTRQVSGTIYGCYDYAFEGKGAWVGHAIVAIDGQPPAKANIVDRNTSITRKPDGAIAGTETITLSFADGTGFEVLGEFTGTPASTPGLYMLHEKGRIANGTGSFGQATGHIAIEGPFLLPDPATTPGAPPWVAEIHGVIENLK